MVSLPSLKLKWVTKFLTKIIEHGNFSRNKSCRFYTFIWPNFCYFASVNIRNKEQTKVITDYWCINLFGHMVKYVKTERLLRGLDPE